MSAIVAAIIGALVGSLTSLSWEIVLKPRRERTSVAAALNAEIAFVVLILDRALSEASPSDVPIDFHAPTTVYRALSGRLGELPPDLSFVLATLYSALDEANTIPALFQSLRAQQRSIEPGNRSNEMRRVAARFRSLLESAEAASSLAHRSLDKLSPGVRIELSKRDTASAIAAEQAG